MEGKVLLASLKVCLKMAPFVMKVGLFIIPATPTPCGCERGSTDAMLQCIYYVNNYV